MRLIIEADECTIGCMYTILDNEIEHGTEMAEKFGDDDAIEVLEKLKKVVKDMERQMVVEWEARIKKG